MTEPGRFLLLDATAALVRCGHQGRRTGLSSRGTPTGTLLLFINMVARIIRVTRATHVMLCWDGPDGAAWRQEIFPGYKAGRYHSEFPESWPARDQAWRFCEAAGLRSLVQPGFEGDDMIAACWRLIRAESWRLRSTGQLASQIIIASDDGDLEQLLEPGTTLVGLGASASSPLDHLAIRVIYGCAPVRIPLMKALAGDSSDGIPGAPGVGRRRALTMLTVSRWSLQDVMARERLRTAGSRKASHWADPAQLERYRQIMDLREPPKVPVLCAPDAITLLLQATRWEPPEPDSMEGSYLDAYLRTMELSSVARRFQEGTLWRDE